MLLATALSILCSSVIVQASDASHATIESNLSSPWQTGWAYWGYLLQVKTFVNLYDMDGLLNELKKVSNETS